MIRLARTTLAAGAAVLLATTVFDKHASSAEDAQMVPPPKLDVPAAGGPSSFAGEPSMAAGRPSITAGKPAPVLAGSPPVAAGAPKLAAGKPNTPASGPQTAVLSGGCFWGVQGVFEHVRGVQRVLAGYTGGRAADADYETVSTGETGHAESVQITYDPAVISYGHILQIFFSVALDPTTKNAQGPDSGTQYRSEVWAANADQARVARAYLAQLDAAHTFHAPVATRVDALRGFYPAEAYHQDFLERNPDYPYIVYNDLPKVAALKALFPADYVAKASTSGYKS